MKHVTQSAKHSYAQQLHQNMFIYNSSHGADYVVVEVTNKQ